MDISIKDKGVYVFGPYRLDPGRRLLLREGPGVTLPPPLFDTLLYLVDVDFHAELTRVFH